MYRIIINELVFIQGGTFQMGDMFGDGDSNEKPVHSVTLRSFYVSKYEVTQSLYQSVMNSNPSYFTGIDYRPVEEVSWYDAINFCNSLSQRDRLTPCYMVNGTNVTCNFNANGYRLGTEAEWEFAAKGGTLSQGYKYSGSDTADNVAWYFDNTGGQTHPVGTKAPNELGLYDMSGNVWEWCWDWYGYYSSEALTDPTGPSSGSDRVFRGGSWIFYSSNVRVASRYRGDPTTRYYTIGFRLFRAGE
jgi:formylglycine-generating enzyme required for sulfatase activity